MLYNFWQFEIGKIEDEMLLAIIKFEQCRLYVGFFTRDLRICTSSILYTLHVLW